jgi:hypothetical protein
MITEYKSLMEAAKRLDELRYAVYKEEGESPVWQMLEHARMWVLLDAKEILRSES